MDGWRDEKPSGNRKIKRLEQSCFFYVFGTAVCHKVFAVATEHHPSTPHPCANVRGKFFKGLPAALEKRGGRWGAQVGLGGGWGGVPFIRFAATVCAEDVPSLSSGAPHPPRAPCLGTMVTKGPGCSSDRSPAPSSSRAPCTLVNHLPNNEPQCGASVLGCCTIRAQTA